MVRPLTSHRAILLVYTHLPLTLPVPGVYIVRMEGKAIKVVRR